MNPFNTNNPWAHMENSSKGEFILSTGCSQRFVHSLYLGYDRLGRYVFLLKLPEGNKDINSVLIPTIKGCSSELFEYNSSTFFSLALGNKKDWRLFKLLCQEIVTELEEHTKQENEYLLKVLSDILTRCGRFFAKSKDSLTREKALGLFGELYFLYKIVAPLFGLKSAIASWKGPLGLPQDFSVEDTIIEVKTTESAHGRVIMISSIEQLCFLNFNGFLHVVTVNEGALNGSRYSLKSLVEELTVQCEIESIDITDLMTKLDLVGYSESSTFAKEEYTVIAEDFYEVRDKFPRILPNDLPQGVVNVKYSINLNSCEQFKQSPKWLNHD